MVGAPRDSHLWRIYLFYFNLGAVSRGHGMYSSQRYVNVQSDVLG